MRDIKNTNTNSNKVVVSVNLNTDKRKPRRKRAAPRVQDTVILPDPGSVPQKFTMSDPYGSQRGQVVYPSVTRIYGNTPAPVPDYFQVPLTNVQNTMNDLRNDVAQELAEVGRTLQRHAQTPEAINRIDASVQDLQARFEASLQGVAGGPQAPPFATPSGQQAAAVVGNLVNDEVPLMSAVLGTPARPPSTGQSSYMDAVGGTPYNSGTWAGRTLGLRSNRLFEDVEEGDEGSVAGSAAGPSTLPIPMPPAQPVLRRGGRERRGTQEPNFAYEGDPRYDRMGDLRRRENRLPSKTEVRALIDRLQSTTPVSQRAWNSLVRETNQKIAQWRQDTGSDVPWVPWAPASMGDSTRPVVQVLDRIYQLAE